MRDGLVVMMQRVEDGLMADRLSAWHGLGIPGLRRATTRVGRGSKTVDQGR